jgi:hypothetical protein
MTSGAGNAEKSANDFIEKHRNGVCVDLSFIDYYRARAAAQKAGRPFLTNEGKNIPTPSQLLSKLVGTCAKSDFAVQALYNRAETGVVIRVMFKQRSEALYLAKLFQPATLSQHFQRSTEAHV